MPMVVYLCLSVVTLLFSVCYGSEEVAMKYDEDVGKTVEEIIRTRGYHVETHEAITQDGYILTLYRLRYSYVESQLIKKGLMDQVPDSSKPAVLMVHGLLDSSFTWVNNYRTQSLAFLLADQNYDVWLGNNRGTTWSKRHILLPSESIKYWDFSWENMASDDFPTFVYHVLRVTHRETISYVGHSEGTMQAFASFSENKDIAKRISFFGALAPVTYIKHQRSPIFGSLVTLQTDKLFQFLGIREFLSGDTFIQNLLGTYGCDWAPQLCGNVLNMFNGKTHNLNNSRIPVYISQTPAGTSVKNIAHFAQGVRHGTFGRFDYGCTCDQFPFKYFPDNWCPFSCLNQEKYGSRQPPQYNLTNIQYPRMAFFIGDSDVLATKEDGEKMMKEIPDTSIVFKSVVNFNHLDFTWAKNANSLVYSDLIDLITKYEGVAYN